MNTTQIALATEDGILLALPTEDLRVLVDIARAQLMTGQSSPHTFPPSECQRLFTLTGSLLDVLDQ